MTNDQLGELVRSHILALRGEVTRRFEEINGRLDDLSADLLRHGERLDEIQAGQRKLLDKLEKQER